MATERATRWSNLAFGAAFGATLLLLVRVVIPFLVPVLVGGFVVVIFDPLHERLVLALRGRRRLGAALSSLGVFVLLLVPTGIAVYVLVREAVQLLGLARKTFGPAVIEELSAGRLPRALVERAGMASLATHLQQLTTYALRFTSGLLKELVGQSWQLGLGALLVAVSMYYLFLDGRRLVAEALRISPLEERHQKEFFREFREVTQAMVYANLAVALAQGVFGIFGFWIGGLPEPVVWGAMMGFLSMVPVVGTPLVWVPAGLVLLLTGHTAAGLFVFAWGGLVIVAIDHLVRVYVVQGRMRVHPLLVFMTLFGGLAAFGPVGLFLGPLVGALFTAMIRIWGRDFAPRLHASGLDGNRRASG